MPIDPNWYYSSLAQCAAALTGVIAAVAIARLQQQVSTLRSLRGDMEAAVLNAYRALASVEEVLTTFASWAEDVRARRAAQSGASGVALPAERSLTFAVLAAEHVTSADEANKFYERLEERMSFVRDVRPRLAALIDARTAAAVITANAFLKFYAAQIFASREDRHLLDEVIRHTQTVAIFSKRVESERSLVVPVLILIALAWLAYFGVICPLWHLALANQVSEMQTLRMFAVGVGALLALLLYEIGALWRIGKYKLQIKPETPAA